MYIHIILCLKQLVLINIHIEKDNRKHCHFTTMLVKPACITKYSSTYIIVGVKFQAAKTQEAIKVQCTTACLSMFSW